MFFVDQSLINLEEQNIDTFNPFHATDLFWNALKTSENLWFSHLFRVYQEISDMKWVKQI